jgi:hypothetical protein
MGSYAVTLFDIVFCRVNRINKKEKLRRGGQENVSLRNSKKA